MENYPVFPINNFTYHKDPQFKRYLNFCKHIINHTQDERNLNTGEVYMSFYPIAKNVRFLASFMTQNILMNKRSIISNLARHGEDKFIIDIHKNRWHPWIWSRGLVQGNYSNQEGWEQYFDSFSKKAQSFQIIGEIERPPDDTFVFYLNLACILYTHQFSEKYRNEINEYARQLKWPTTKVLALQIRRGEIASKKGEHIYDRPYIPLENYIERTDLFLKNNPDFTHIYISTDSDEEIENIRMLRPQWNLIILPIDHSKFYRCTGNNVDVEGYVMADISRIPFVTGTAMADMYFMGQCQGIVGTMTNSAFARLAFFLQMANQEMVVPYYDMNEKVFDFRERDMLLLL